jgi:hypothetical protein
VAETNTGLPTAGWYADPRVPKQLRWWDGDGWTNNVHIPDTGAAHPAESTLLPGIADQDDGKWEFPQS